MFDADRGRVVGRTSVSYRDLLLHEDRNAAVDAGLAGQALAEAVRPQAGEIFRANEDAATILARLHLLREKMPEHPWPLFDDAELGEVLAEARPHRVVRALRIPDERARVEERGLLPGGVAMGALEVQEVRVVVLDQPLLSGPERPLRPSVVALDRLGDVHATELLQLVVHDPLPEDRVPRARERLRDGRDVGPDGLRLGPWRSVPARTVKIVDELRIGECRRVDVAEARHLHHIRNTP